MFPNAPLGSFTAATRRSGSGREWGRGLVFTTANESNRFSPAREGRSRRSLLTARRSNDYCKRGKGRGGGRARPVPAADGAGRTRPHKAPFACLLRRIRLGVGGAGPGTRILRLDGLRGLGRALSDIAHGGASGERRRGGGAALRGSVPEPRPAGANPSGPSASSRRGPKAASRPRAAAGEETGRGGRKEPSGAERRARPGRPHLAPASGLQPNPAAPSGSYQPEDKEGFLGFPPPTPHAAAGGEAAAFAPKRTRACSSRESGRERGRTNGREAPARPVLGFIHRGKSPAAWPARRSPPRKSSPRVVLKKKNKLGTGVKKKAPARPRRLFFFSFSPPGFLCPCPAR